MKILLVISPIVFALDIFSGLSPAEWQKIDKTDFQIEERLKKSFTPYQKIVQKMQEVRLLPSNRKNKFPTYKMLSEYWELDAHCVSYLPEIFKERCRLTLIEGRLYTNTGNLFHTDRGPYVMDGNGKLYSCPPNIRKNRNFYHSSYLSGKPVLVAGEIIVFKGRIYQMDTESGHYQPSYSHLEIAREYLMSKGAPFFHILRPF